MRNLLMKSDFMRMAGGIGMFYCFVVYSCYCNIVSKCLNI